MKDDGEIPPHRPPTPAAAAPPPLPIQPHQETTTSGYRSHRWSEAATAVLIDAWTKRHLDRGCLSQHDWKDVADIVAAREGRRCTVVHCKNRIDTVKKKYKAEKSLVANGLGPSYWPFFNQLDELFNPSAGDATKIPMVIPVGAMSSHRKRSKRPPVADSDEPEPGNSSDGVRKWKKPETYEQEMEKERMKFQNDLELQRMQYFIEPSQPKNNGDSNGDDPINESDSDELESLILDALSMDLES